jgi:hypothetical protein
MIRHSLMIVLALLLPAAAQASEAQLWIVDPAPGADLADCPGRAAAAAESKAPSARPLTSDAVVHWQAGKDLWPERDLPLRGASGVEEDVHRLTDRCFALTVNGRAVVAGAILWPQSARLLRFPVLGVMTRKPGLALRFELTPAFPAQYSTTPPHLWGEKLAILAGGSEDADFKAGPLGRLPDPPGKQVP